MISSENLLMKPTEMPTYRETENHWLTGLPRQKQELSIQLAKPDLEIGIVRGALRSRERARTKCVSQHRES
jgi:hypothetical protein